MNMFRAFESRVAEAFGASQMGYAAPFSFRKLARRAAREMEQETYIVDDVETAPALITVLVSADDDAMMRPLYGQLTEEISNFVEAEAARKGYVFVGKPLARFMVDQSLRHGRFAVFANNVDSLTLLKLREEEEAFLSGFGAFGGAASDSAPGIVTPVEEGEPYADPLEGLYAEPEPARSEVDDSAIGLSVMPSDFVDPQLGVVSAPEPAVAEARSLAESLPEVADIEANPIVTPVSEVVGQQVPEIPQVPGAPAEIAVPATIRRDVATPQDTSVAGAAAPEPVVEAEPATCLLIDRQSGRTYIGTAPKTFIGRERTPGSIVLHDPNVSRHHAELTFDGTTWRIHDLGSTNGTLVNDVDIDLCVLRDGDLITLGLLNLEFRES